MSLNTDDCNNVKNFIENQDGKDYGLSKGEKTQHVFSVILMLMTLQLYCSKKSSEFRSSEKIILIELN